MGLLASPGLSARPHPPGSTTLFSASEAFAGTCAAKSTLCTANIATGIMVASFAEFLGHVRPEVDVRLNLVAWEMTIRSPASA